MRPSPDSATRGPYAVEEAPAARSATHIDLLVDELLDAVQERLALLAVQLARLLLEQPVDVGVAAVGVGAARDDEGLEPGGRVAERAARP